MYFKLMRPKTNCQLLVDFLELHFNCVNSCLLNLRYIFFIFKQHFVVLFHCWQLILFSEEKKNTFMYSYVF